MNIKLTEGLEDYQNDILVNVAKEQAKILDDKILNKLKTTSLMEMFSKIGDELKERGVNTVAGYKLTK